MSEEDQAMLAQAKMGESPVKKLRMRHVLQRIPVARSTIVKWIDEEKFPKPHKINGLVFWDESVIEDFMSARSK